MRFLIESVLATNAETVKICGRGARVTKAKVTTNRENGVDDDRGFAQL